MDFKKKLLLSTEYTTRDMLAVSEKFLEEDPDREDYFIYESKYKAHLYHYLLLDGINPEDLHFEWRPDNDTNSLDHIDLWFKDPGKRYNILIEVKQVYGLNRRKNDIRIVDYRSTDKRSGKPGIIKDVAKLENACKFLDGYNGIMLMYLADPKVGDTVDLNGVRKSVLRQSKTYAKINLKKTELLWTSRTRTEYVSLD